MILTFTQINNNITPIETQVIPSVLYNPLMEYSYISLYPNNASPCIPLLRKA